MISDEQYFVYIVANKSRTLYIGVTGGLFLRMEQHRRGAFEGFTKRYKIDRLVYFERFQYIDNAIAREKELKGWLRSKKVALIEVSNPAWADIYPLMLQGKWKEKRVVAPAEEGVLVEPRLTERKQILRFAQDDDFET